MNEFFNNRIFFGLFVYSDMNSFIPEEDKPAFHKFLSDNNLQPKSEVGAKPPPPPPNMPHPPGEVEGGAPTNVDSFLLDLDKENDEILTTNF